MCRSCTRASGEPGTAISRELARSRPQAGRRPARGRCGRAAGRAGPWPGRRARRAAASRTCPVPARARAAAPAAPGLSASVPRNAAMTIAKERPRTGSGTSGIGGKWMMFAHDVISSGSAGSSAVQRAQDLGGPLEAEEQRARVELPHRHDRELDRGHDAEVPAAAAQRPEQLGLVRRVGAHELAVGGDELDRGHRVGLQAVLAGQPADAAAERVADDADVRRGAVQAARPCSDRRGVDVLPERRRADAHAARLGVDGEPGQRRRVEEQRPLQRAERRRVVARGLGRDPPARARRA